MAKWKPIKLNLLSKDNQRIYDVLNQESDISCALIGASFLSELLASILKNKFIESSISYKILDPKNGTIGSFAARTDLTYCLGFIDKEIYRDLVKIANIRNNFAHSHLDLTFNSDSISGACDELQYWRTIKYFKTSSKKQITVTPRDKFNMTVVLICQKLQVGTLLNQENKT